MGIHNKLCDAPTSAMEEWKKSQAGRLSAREQCDDLEGNASGREAHQLRAGKSYLDGETNG